MGFNTVTQPPKRLDLGLTLLAKAQLPYKFWDLAFQTAVYLINRQPSKSVQGHIPNVALFNNKPVYAFLRILG